MTAQLISRSAVAVLLDAGENADRESARELVLSLLTDAGFSPWEDMEIELFPGGRGALLVARRTDMVTDGYRFEDFEALLQAAYACPVEYPAQLLSCGGAYFLVLRHPCPDCGVDMSEFCLDGSLAPDMLSHVREHGKVLIDRDAIEKLRKIFV
ncbi:MAG: hypothetical protein ACOX81_10715 [Candidatus Heteroscillospira sp.]|jgi:hypothetical protein